MRCLPIILALAASPVFFAQARAWDGFDAATTELVEIIPDDLPAVGETVQVRNYDKDTTETVIVESVKANRRTIEIVILDQKGERHTLVMEAR